MKPGRMKLSVIIVNYKVPHFLRQCLMSTQKALNAYNAAAEIIVFDNKSADGSEEMCKRFFPDVRYIASSENLGFSKANNAAFRQASGEFILILNPDTLLPEDLFLEIMPYFDKHANIGAMGVKLTNADGRFHPESKRAYPTPARAFYKLFGLAYLFPRSKRFNQYRLSLLDADGIHDVEILVGAFMLLRREVAEKTGLFDEDFFMYGEDIDLSYRILEFGFKNVYYGQATVLHYKGESTKMYSHRYVKVFYQAMRIFVRKHYAGRSSMAAFLLNGAVHLREAMAHAVLSFKNMLRKPAVNQKNSTVGKNVFVIGDENDAAICSKVFCQFNETCRIRSVYSPSSDSFAADELDVIIEIVKKNRPDTIIYNTESYSVSLFLKLMCAPETEQISFYSLANDRTCIIGKELYCIEKDSFTK